MLCSLRVLALLHNSLQLGEYRGCSLVELAGVSELSVGAQGLVLRAM